MDTRILSFNKRIMSTYEERQRDNIKRDELINECCGNNDSAKASALYFKTGDENDLFEKLRTLLNNEELRKDLINSGKENIKRFNRKNFIKEFEKIYK